MRDDVLDHVRRHGSASRPELESVLGMSRKTVAAVAQDLLDSGLLTDHQGTGVGRGRLGRRLLPRYPSGAVEAVRIGAVSEQFIDEKVLRLLRLAREGGPARRTRT